jgi:hypothetical protein
MGCLWRTDAMPFIEEYEPRGPGFERFFYGMCSHQYVFRIARAHDALLTRGAGPFLALLWNRCELHDHVGKEEEKKCWAWRGSLVKKGWQGEWEKSMKQQMKANLSRKDPKVGRLPPMQNNSAGVAATREVAEGGRAVPSKEGHITSEVVDLAEGDSDDDLYRGLTPAVRPSSGNALSRDDRS